MAAAAAAGLGGGDGTDVKNTAYVRAALESNVAQLKAKVRELTDDIEYLRSTRSKVSTETQEFVAYATAELKAKDDVIADLRAKLHDAEFARETDVRKLQAQMQTALETAISEQRSMEAELRDKLRGAEVKLERAAQFLERRDEMETRIEELQATLEAERGAHRVAFADLERKYLVDKSAVMKAHQAQYQELRRQARAEVQRALDEDTKRILFENKQMGEQLRLQAEETKLLAKERLATAEQARVLAREVEIYADKEKEWARQGSRKTLENKALKARIEELEAALAAERSEREGLRTGMHKRFEKDTEDLRLELDGMRSLGRMKAKELHTLKKLSAIVLQQRTEVEQFLLDALAEVKLAVARRKKAAAAAVAASSRTPLERAGIGSHLGYAPTGGASGRLAAGAGRSSPRAGAGGTVLTLTIPTGAGARLPAATGLTLPQVTHGRPGGGGVAGLAGPPTPLRAVAAGVLAGDPSVISLPPGVEEGEVEVSMADARRVDYADLTPEDKERVLRLLFAKINSFAAAPPSAPGTASMTHVDLGEASVTSSIMGGGGGGTGPESGGSGDDDGGGGGSTALGAPFGLAADIPDALHHLEYGSGGGGGTTRTAPGSSGGGPGARSTARPPLSASGAPAAVFAVPPVGELAPRLRPQPPRSAYSQLIADALADTAVDAASLPDTAALAEALASKAAEREALTRRFVPASPPR